MENGPKLFLNLEIAKTSKSLLSLSITGDLNYAKIEHLQREKNAMVANRKAEVEAKKDAAFDRESDIHFNIFRAVWFVGWLCNRSCDYLQSYCIIGVGLSLGFVYFSR